MSKETINRDNERSEVTALSETSCKILLFLSLFVLGQNLLGGFGTIALGMGVSDADVKNTISATGPQTSDKHITMVIVIHVLTTVARNWVS